MFRWLNWLTALARRLRIGWPRHYTALVNQGAYALAGQDAALTYTPAADTTPSQFTFTDQTGVATSTAVTSAPVTIVGLSVGTFITINASGGTIDKNGDANFLGSQLVQNGDAVRARVTTSSSNSTAVNCTVAASPSGVQDTFTATTAASVGGSVADGAAYNFTSTAPSTKSATVSFLGGLNGYLNTFTDKARANPPPANWVGPNNPTTGTGPGGEYPQVTSNMPTASNAPVLTRKALGYYDYSVGGTPISSGNPSNWDAFGYAYNHGSAIPEYFHHGYVYFGHTDTTNTQLQWKVLRDSASPVTIVDGSPQTRYFHWKSSDDFFVATGPNGQFGGGVYFVGDTTSTFPNNLPAFNTGQWYRWEFWKRCSSGTGVADGASTVRMWRFSDGVQMANFSFPNQTHFTDSARTQYVIMQNYFGNGNGTLLEPAGGFAYWCDPGIQAGAVGSAQRSIWLGDASTYAACNKGKLIYQEDSGAWSGTARSVTLNKGHYSSITGQSLWLYERDNSGNAVNASGIPLV